MPQEPLTTRQLITQLERLVRDYPEAETYRVHILDMDEGKPQDESWAGLVTTVVLDAFSREQGMVVALFAEHEPYVRHSPASESATDS